MADSPGPDWGSIPVETWRSTPFVGGRVANEEDVREGRAVFYVDGPSQAAALPLPHCALFHTDEGRDLPVVLIQAEIRYDGQVLVGYRPLAGGNGICMLSELALLDGPNELFAATGQTLLP